MKSILLLFLFGISFAQAQTINAYYGQLGPNPNTEGINHRSYVVVTSSTPVDQSPSGVNATWNFTGLSGLGPTVYDNTSPSAGETSTYPGTTMVTTNINSVGIVMTTSKLYTVANQAITGATSEATGININYTDNATIGTFPLTFGYTNTDAIAGTYAYTTYSGTFTGNIVSSVDAYGTLTTNDYGFGPNEIDVVRLKTVQTLNLNYLIFTNVGTATITSYHYYMTGQLFPFFTSATTAINVPQLSIDQTVTAMEAAAGTILGTPNFNAGNVSIAPNPVRDFLSVQTGGNVIQSVSIADVNGRTILNGIPSDNSLNVSNLAKGVYFVRIETDSGTLTKKIVKE